jgi:hypothetical protein
MRFGCTERTHIRALDATIADVQRKVGEPHGLKQNLGGRGSNVNHCGSVPPELRDIFCRALDRSTEKKRAR